jgi:hypothetical protein
MRPKLDCDRKPFWFMLLSPTGAEEASVMRATRLGAVALLIFIADLICGAQAVHRLGPNFRFLPVLLQGTPGFSTTPASPIDLGPSAVGMTTPHAFSLQLQINNPGSAALSISSFSFFPAEAGFTAESTFLPPFSIAAGSSKPTAVLFTPQGAGKRTVQLSVSDNAPGSPHIVQFTGTGVTVPANDYAVILDPGVPSSVNVTAGNSTSFPVWLLAGSGLGVTSLTVQCSGGPTGTACSLDHNSSLLVGDGFGSTRDKFMVSVSVPAKSALNHHGLRGIGWSFAVLLGVLLAGGRRRNLRFVGVIVAGLMASAVMISCGGSGSGGGSNSLVITATPTPGTPHSLNVPIVVQ